MDADCQFPRDFDPSDGGAQEVLHWHLAACPTCREELAGLVSEARDV